MMNREQSRGWRAWQEMRAEHAAFMQLLRKGLSFMVNRKAAMAFASWVHAIPNKRNADPMSKALLYFSKRELAKGWVSWHSHWDEQRRRLWSMKRSLGHMMSRGQARAWGAWLEMILDQAAFIQKLRRGVSFMVNRKLALAFASWAHAFPASCLQIRCQRP